MYKINKGVEVKLILYLIVLTTIILSVNSLEFNSNPEITPLPAYSNDDLTCSWEVSGDTTEVNVTWYKGGVFFNQTLNIFENDSTINYINTIKNEEWVCNITISNGTHTTYSEDSVTIDNSPPSLPEVYDWNLIEIENSIELNEDQTYLLYINSSDIDNDRLIYSVSSNSSNFCKIINDSLGTVNCSPTNTNLENVNTSGTHILKFEVDEQAEFARYIEIQFNIIPVNDAPYFSDVLSDKSINEDEIFNYNIYGADEESNFPLNFSISVNPSLDLIINISDNTSAIIMFDGNRPAHNSEAGENYTINVTLYDSLNANSTYSFELEIIQTNDAPVLENISTQNGTQGNSSIFNVYAYDVDENDELNFSISPSPSLGTCPIPNPWQIETTNNSNNATGLINISNLTNNHIVCRNVRITVDDGKDGEDHQEVFLNLTNVNDAPVMYDISYDSRNTGGNNISNLTAYAKSLFNYVINATDVDNITYEGEILNFTNNGSLFNIDSSSGLIEFTLNQSQLGNYTIQVNVSDDGGLLDSKIMYLSVLNNSAPILTHINNISCLEDSLCYVQINATDSDGHNLSFTTNNSAVLNFTNNISQNPVNDAYLNFTYNQSFVGTYQIIVFVMDEKGAKENQTIELTINNTNDAPEIESFTFPQIVETHTVNFYVYANDEDYNLPENYANISVNNETNVSEYLTFNNTNITGANMFNISTVFNISSNQTYGRIYFTPDYNDTGNYSVNITVTDYNGVETSVIKNFSILIREDAPNITHIRPYGGSYSNETHFSWANSGLFYENTTHINFAENRSVLYAINVTDSTSEENLTYEWYINEVFESNASSINISYGFFSSGQYNITVYVEDKRFEISDWSWNITVNNVNRAALLMNNLIDLNGDNAIESESTFLNYLKKYPDVKFIDPDDDLNSNGDIDANETSNLTYVVDSCSVATITISGHSITVSPVSIGSCNVTFRATDVNSEITWSNSVIINVTDTDDEEDIVYVTTTRTNTREIEVEVKEEVPKAIEVIIPDIILAEEGKEIEIPIILRNNWAESLYDINVGGSANVTGLSLKFSEVYFERIGGYEEIELTSLIIGDFSGDEYEVIISANVSSPSTSDYAMVLIKKGDLDMDNEELQQNIILAQDLLSKNPECLELNEILKDAQNKIANGSFLEAAQIIEGVIGGCQYLTSLAETEKDQPKNIMTNYVNNNLMKYLKLLIGLILLSVAMVFGMHNIRKRNKKRKQTISEKENSEN